MVSVGEKMSIDCTSWWESSLARDKSHLRLWHTKEQLFVIHILILKVSAFLLQTAMNALSLTNHNHVLGYFQLLLRFLFTYLSATFKGSICNVSLCSRDMQMLLPVHTPNQTDWLQNESNPGRQLLRGVSHHLCPNHLLLNCSVYPLKCSDFCTD